MNFEGRLKQLGALDAAKTACKGSGVQSVEDLYLPNAHKSVVAARARFCIWLHNEWNWSYPEIGSLLNRDHTSIRYLVLKYGAESEGVMANPIDAVAQEGNPFSRPAEPHDRKPTDPNTPKCHGCGRYHGGTNAEINCMRKVLGEFRSRLVKLEEKISHMTTSSEEVKP